MKLDPLHPFGLVVHADQTAGASSPSILDLPVEFVQEHVDANLVLVLRGFAPLAREDFRQFAMQFGPLLSWDFGEVLDLRIEAQAANHIFTSGRVELHWDGAYLGTEKTPHYNMFQCLKGSEQRSGGETIFTNARAVWDQASDAEKSRWEQMTITYLTEKKAHFGGEFKHPLISRHPLNGNRVVRYIEAFNEDNAKINPVDVSIDGCTATETQTFLQEFNQRLYRDQLMYKHAWRTGDFLIAENHSVLHGRSRFEDPDDSRHLQRIHVL